MLRRCQQLFCPQTMLFATQLRQHANVRCGPYKKEGERVSRARGVLAAAARVARGTYSPRSSSSPIPPQHRQPVPRDRGLHARVLDEPTHRALPDEHHATLVDTMRGKPAASVPAGDVRARDAECRGELPKRPAPADGPLHLGVTRAHAIIVSHNHQETLRDGHPETVTRILALGTMPASSSGHIGDKQRDRIKCGAILGSVRTRGGAVRGWATRPSVVLLARAGI